MEKKKYADIISQRASIREGHKLSPAEHKQAEILEQNQAYSDLLQSIQDDTFYRRGIARGETTPGHTLRYAGLPRERFYSDLAGRFGDMREKEIAHRVSTDARFGNKDTQLKSYLEKFDKNMKD